MGNYFNYDDELPDFSLGGINSSLDSLFEPATAKPQDWEQAFGKPTFGNQRLKLEGEEAKARDSAFGYLSKVVNRNDDISPSQGIAAALLAAIPTLGGYMMGRNAPKIPDNVFFRNSADLEAFTDPSATALQQGAALGNKVGTGYLNDIEKVAAENRLVNKDLGEMEEKRAERLGTKADALVMEELQQNEINSRQDQMQEFYKSEREAREDFDRNNKSVNPVGFDERIFNQMSAAQQAAFRANKAGVDEKGVPVINKKSGTPPAIIQTEILKTAALADEAQHLSTQLKNYKGSWADLQAARAASGLDSTGEIQDIMRLADKSLRVLSGSAAPPAEAEKIQKFTVGDLSTTTPAQVAQFLERTAQAQRRWGKSLIERGQQLSDPEEAAKMFDNPEDIKRKRLAELRQKKNGINP